MEHTNSTRGSDEQDDCLTDDSITITITETDDDDATNTLDFSDPEDDPSTAPESGPTIEWLTYENTKLRSSIPRLKQAIKMRDTTIKSLRREAKKVTGCRGAPLVVGLVRRRRLLSGISPSLWISIKS